jgi:HEAT repeat protein
MDPIVSSLIVSILIGTGLFSSIPLYRRWRLRNWLSVVELCDLREVNVDSLPMRIQARAGPLEVRLTDPWRRSRCVRVVIVIPGPPGFFRVKISRENPAPWIPPDIEVGDESFDGKFHVEGPVGLVLALLDSKARRLLINANAVSSLEISDGELRAETWDTKLALFLPLFLDIGRQLAQPVDVAQRLAGNAAEDPEAGVRITNLRALVRELPGKREIYKALWSACTDDPSPEVRLWAAKKLDARGVLLELAESSEDGAVSAEAFSIMDRELPFERKKAILGHALRRRHLETARACLESLGRHGAVAVDVLAKVMAREQGELAPLAALALEQTGSLAAEEPLIQALQREQTDLQVVAARVLGHAGSVAAVLPLKEAAEGVPLDSELGRALRQAIAEIQSRLPGATPGQLSLAGGEAGQLSLAQAEAGQLSFAADPAGELSLGDADPEATPKKLS